MDVSVSPTAMSLSILRPSNSQEEKPAEKHGLIEDEKRSEDIMLMPVRYRSDAISIDASTSDSYQSTSSSATDYPDSDSVWASMSVPCPSSPSSASRSTPTPTADEVPYQSWAVMDENARIGQFMCMWRGCYVLFPNGKHLLAHLTSHFDYYCSTNQNASSLPCQVIGCPFTAQDAATLKCHMSMHRYHALKQMDGMKVIQENRDYSHRTECGYPVQLQAEYSGEITFCVWDNCGRGFTDVCEYFDHVSRHLDLEDTKDKRVNKHVCRWDNCNKQFLHRGDFRRHVRYHTGEKQCACPYCGAFFGRVDKLVDHVKRKIDDSDKPYTCMLCMKKFVDEQQLSHHVTNHVSRAQCSICHVLLTDQYNLERHHQAIHNKQPRIYACNVCDKAFTTETTLKFHQSTHLPPQEKCHLCDKVYTRKYLLANHIRTVHENMRQQYHCHLCDVKYACVNNLSRHLANVHDCPIPEGFRTYRYKRCADGFLRLQTKRLRHVDLTIL